MKQPNPAIVIYENGQFQVVGKLHIGVIRNACKEVLAALDSVVIPAPQDGVKNESATEE